MCVCVCVCVCAASRCLQVEQRSVFTSVYCCCYLCYRCGCCCRWCSCSYTTVGCWPTANRAAVQTDLTPLTALVPHGGCMCVCLCVSVCLPLCVSVCARLCVCSLSSRGLNIPVRTVKLANKDKTKLSSVFKVRLWCEADCRGEEDSGEGRWAILINCRTDFSFEMRLIKEAVFTISAQISFCSRGFQEVWTAKRKNIENEIQFVQMGSEQLEVVWNQISAHASQSGHFRLSQESSRWAEAKRLRAEPEEDDNKSVESLWSSTPLQDLSGGLFRERDGRSRFLAVKPRHVHLVPQRAFLDSLTVSTLR